MRTRQQKVAQRTKRKESKIRANERRQQRLREVTPGSMSSVQALSELEQLIGTFRYTGTEETLRRTLDLTKTHNLLKLDVSRGQVAAALACILRKDQNLRRSLMGEYGTEITTALRVWPELDEDEFWLPGTKMEVEQALVSWAVTGDTSWIDRILMCIDAGDDMATECRRRLRIYASRHEDLMASLKGHEQGNQVVAQPAVEKLTIVSQALMAGPDWRRVVFICLDKDQSVTVALYDDPPLEAPLPDIGCDINVRRVTTEELEAVTQQAETHFDPVV